MNTPLRHDDRKFIDQVRRHPVGQGVVTDENRRLTAERQKLIDRINAIEDAAPRENATHDKRVAAATAKVLAAEAEWRAAQGALREALAAQSAEMWSRTAERAQLETALRGTADNDLVDRLRRQVGEEMEALRKVAPETEEITGRGSRLLPGSQAEARKFASKIRSIRVRLKALRGLLDECEALRFTSDQTSIQGRFDAKHADLPPLAVETIGEDELLHGWRA